MVGNAHLAAVEIISSLQNTSEEDKVMKHEETKNEETLDATKVKQKKNAENKS